MQPRQPLELNYFPLLTRRFILKKKINKFGKIFSSFLFKEFSEKKKVFGGPCGRHFLPDMFTVCGPFNKLLKDNEKFVWSQAL